MADRITKSKDLSSIAKPVDPEESVDFDPDTVEAPHLDSAGNLITDNAEYERRRVNGTL